MSYQLFALIGKSQTFKREELSFQNARIVALQQEIAMIPLTDELFEEIDSSDQIGNFLKLSSEVEDWAQQISSKGLVAYVEAEFFGGEGDQSAVAWNAGSCVLGPIYEQYSINRALKLLGVDRKNAHDEFDAMGLGKHRHTSDWK
jgi:hypothetical protein